MKRLAVDPLTFVLGAVALASVALVHADPWHERVAVGEVAAALDKVFAALSEAGAAEPNAITLQPNGGRTATIARIEGGHTLAVDGSLAGPADPEAVDGLLSSLRMATVLRTVPDDVELPSVQQGAIAVDLGDRGSWVLTVGGPTPDGVGVYATLESSEEARTLVVEPELALVLQQSARAWLATRLVVAVPAEVARLEFADAGLVVRGVDGLWRSEFGSVRALLAGVAVDTKIDRLLGARLDPVLEGEAGPPEASAAVTIAGADGRAWSIVALGPCPGHEDRTLVDRGEGWRGCVDSDLIEPWPLPGSDREGAFALVEPRLVPYDLGRVLTIEQTRPERQVLRRYGGDWRLEPDGDPGRAVHVADAEVHSWFRSLHDATVEPHAGERAIDPDVEIVLTSDSTGSMRISCALEDRPGAEVRAWCRRDGGPSLAVRDDIAPAFSAQTFANRELVRFEPHDARAIEILPGRTGVRQGAHLDLGVWKLDAPEHPEPSEAFSDVAIEELLAAVSQLRATRWVDAPDKAALRTIRVDLTPRVDGQSEVTVALHDGCVAVTGGRAAEISDSTCRSLQVDLLHTDPLRFWVDTARELELRLDGHHGRLRRQKDGLEWIEGSDEAAIRAALDRLSGIRVGALEPRREERAAGSLRIIAQSGPAIAIELGSGLRWAAVEGLDWRYGLRSPGAAAE